jgi:hypothetical protein
MIIITSFRVSIIMKQLQQPIFAITISGNGNYNDYNKQKWQVLIFNFANSETSD